MVTGIDIERRWGFLKPWTDVLRRQHPNELCRLQSSPFDPDQLYVPIILPKRVFQDEAQMVQEGLKLLAAVAHVDYDAWKYLLLNYCGVEVGKRWKQDAESEIIVRFKLKIYSNDRIGKDLVEILGVQQHYSLRREYAEALARIAAMDNSLDTKRWGLEISVPIEVLFMKENGEERTLDELFRLHDAKEIIRRDWDERSLPQIEAGAFRCNFVLSAMKAKLEKYREPVDLDMAKRIDELVHDNVWFSRVSRKLGFNDTRPRRGVPTRDWETDSHTLVTLQHLDLTSFSTLNEWEALRSSAILSQTTWEWNLPYVAGLWHSKHWWKWLAYSFFSKQARMRSPLEAIALTDIESMATTEIESFCGILSSESPEEELLDCACEFSGVQDATLAANSPIRWDFDEQNEPVLSSDVLKFASPIPFLRILSKSGETEWVDVVVPGYGRCQVQRENLELNEEVGILPGYNLKALKIHFPRLETVDISGLPLFFAAVGSSLRTLTIDSGEEVDVDVSMVLERCPNLEQMCLVHREQDVSILNFSDFHAAGFPLPTITYNVKISLYLPKS